MAFKLNNVTITGKASGGLVPPLVDPRLGKAWQAVPSGSATGGYQAVMWSPELEKFCIAGYWNVCANSTDGRTWIASSMPIRARTGTWAPSLGKFVTLSDGGETNGIMNSTNGVNWTVHPNPAPANECHWKSVCWSPELGLFVAVTQSYVRIATSTNGINWTWRSLPSGANVSFNSVCWSSELGLFVAVSSNPTTGVGGVITSPNGINWTARKAAYNGAGETVCWSPELGLFVSLLRANMVGGQGVMTSPDGITWAANAGMGNATWENIIWCKEAGLFVAIGAFSGYAAYSPNGVNWTAIPNAGANVQWRGLGYSPKLKMIVAAAPNSPGYIMVSPPEP